MESIFLNTEKEIDESFTLANEGPQIEEMHFETKDDYKLFSNQPLKKKRALDIY